MVSTYQKMEDALAARKRATGATWMQIITWGIEKAEEKAMHSKKSDEIVKEGG